jgi:hypothetical protein
MMLKFECRIEQLPKQTAIDKGYLAILFAAISCVSRQKRRRRLASPENHVGYGYARNSD